jgi:hypothetical protein
LTDVTAVERALDGLLDQRVSEVFGHGARNARVAVRIQVEQARARLRKFAGWHAEWIADGWRVEAVEVSTPEGGTLLDVDGQAVGIRARIDRVDHHAERGEWALFDYKTGDTPVDIRKQYGNGEWKDLQLPLYGWLFPWLRGGTGNHPLAYEAGAPIRLGLIALSRASGPLEPAFGGWTGEELDSAVETARDVVRMLRAGTIAFDERLVPSYTDPRMRALLGLGLLGAEEDDA